MILCDTGPLLALIDPKQPEHGLCTETLRRVHLPLITTWPCMTEAAYFLGDYGGWPYQKELWSYRRSGMMVIYPLSDADEVRCEELMEKYQDRPMDLADSSLVTLAERSGIRRIFTLDSDFRFYRTADGGTFEIVP